jgi:hypothetical protein
MPAQPYQLKYWGPDVDGRKDKGTSSYKSLDTARGNACRAVASRTVRCPASHVQIIDRSTGRELYFWDGPDVAPIEHDPQAERIEA